MAQIALRFQKHIPQRGILCKADIYKFTNLIPDTPLPTILNLHFIPNPIKAHIQHIFFSAHALIQRHRFQKPLKFTAKLLLGVYRILVKRTPEYFEPQIPPAPYHHLAQK